MSDRPPSCARPSTPSEIRAMSANAHTTTVSHRCWRCKPMRSTCAFCGPMAMINEMLNTMPAVKVGKARVMASGSGNQRCPLGVAGEWGGVCPRADMI
ncbi:hypothetical protein D9M68_955310 [compost metagenome]